MSTNIATTNAAPPPVLGKQSIDKSLVDIINKVSAMEKNIPAVVDSTGLADDISDILTVVTRAEKDSEALYKFAKRPIDDALSSLRAKFLPINDKLAAVKALCKQRLVAWEQLQRKRAAEHAAKENARLERERQEALKKAKAAEKRGNNARAEELKAQVEAITPVVPAAPEAPSSGAYFTSWKFSITNESEIPREYLVPDLVRIGKVVRALKGDTKIAGIQVYEEKSIRAT